ncbi:hypothetical protein K402DRAFT_180729 [Aulographum hederae CBS 113979]|uniref:Uncharacterized protein n=1 Tax=Aulographum hederae CBS 113979 TaxID=1176131 RepID=A0A6G1GQC8_9PEZI|nr:hypothetical protein K402DRAFT_180729 [Aulographum hederae CBS 113979]
MVSPGHPHALLGHLNNRGRLTTFGMHLVQLFSVWRSSSGHHIESRFWICICICRSASLGESTPRRQRGGASRNFLHVEAGLKGPCSLEALVAWEDVDPRFWRAAGLEWPSMGVVVERQARDYCRFQVHRISHVSVHKPQAVKSCKISLQCQSVTWPLYLL